MSASAESWMEDLQSLRLTVQRTIKNIHKSISDRYYLKFKEQSFEPGDRVWVRRSQTQGRKLDPLWIGPCEVLSRHGSTGRYTISFPEGIQNVHIDRLKLYLPKIDSTKNILHFFKPHEPIPEDDAFVVEKILSHRVKTGKHQWLVKWKGYDNSFNSWEPATSFVGYLQQDWLKFNRDNHIHFLVGDLK